MVFPTAVDFLREETLGRLAPPADLDYSFPTVRVRVKFYPKKFRVVVAAHVFPYRFYLDGVEFAVRRVRKVHFRKRLNTIFARADPF